MIFIILMAFVSMFSDMTHEGANSMNGSFEEFLGAGPLIISLVGGVASLLGLALRFLTGYLADKTKKYWLFTIIGYAVDLVAVPLLALVPENGWVLAICFILLEKVGKAVKKPAKDTLVSFAATENGVGKSFAFGELLDQIGAALGPFVLTITYLITGDIPMYQKYVIGFAALGIPAVVCFGLLLFAFSKYKHPERFEKEKAAESNKSFLKKPAFILFVAASCLMALGFLDSFSLINVQLKGLNVVGTDFLPLLYSYAMLIDAVSAVVFGLLFDKKGFISIFLATILCSSYSFFIFMINQNWAVYVGLTLWGIGIGAEESVMKSAVTTLSGKNERARAFGTYEMAYGVFSFAGSFLIGWLYGQDYTSDHTALCVVSFVAIFVGSFIYLLSNHYLNLGKGHPLVKRTQDVDFLADIEEFRLQNQKSKAMALLESRHRAGQIDDYDYEKEKTLLLKEL